MDFLLNHLWYVEQRIPGRLLSSIASRFKWDSKIRQEIQYVVYFRNWEGKTFQLLQIGTCLLFDHMHHELGSWLGVPWSNTAVFHSCKTLILKKTKNINIVRISIFIFIMFIIFYRWTPVPLIAEIRARVAQKVVTQMKLTRLKLIRLKLTRLKLKHRRLHHCRLWLSGSANFFNLWILNQPSLCAHSPLNTFKRFQSTF